MNTDDANEQDFQTKLWISDGLTFKYAEKDHGIKQNTGVCFSGGGTRSLAATMGQLRGLNHLNLIGNIDYISCVSGGSWASTAYTYYKTNPPGNQGPIDDDMFLGPVTEPANIQVNKPADPDQNWLGFDGPQRLGTTATGSLAGAILEVIFEWSLDYLISKGLSPLSLGNWETALENIPYDKVWIAAVGLTYFKPFGLFQLYNPFNPSSLQGQPYFSLDASTVQDIRNRNKNNSAVLEATFDTVCAESGEPPRPYLVVNSSVIGPSALAPFKTENPIVFEYTPLYTGSAYSPFGQKVDYGPNNELLVGAGFVEPFAFGGSSPAAAPTECSPPDPQALCASAPPPSQPFTLADASGTSSSAFASVVEQDPFRFIKGLNVNGLEKFLLGVLISLLQKETDLLQLAPESLYWPVTDSGGEPTTRFTFGDGGVLENYGLISLLRRKVKTIIVFINTSTKLNVNYDSSKPITAADIDNNLPPLFGIQTASPGIFTQHNQVFPKNEFDSVFNQLKDAKENGRTVMAQCAHTVAQNDWWGVQGVKLDADGNRADPDAPVGPDDQMTVLWVYNDRVTEWENLLPDTEFDAKGLGQVTLAEAIAAGNPQTGKPRGPFQNFPNYATVGQNSDFELVELTPQQVNLLADLSCWNITNNAVLFKQLLAPSGDADG